MNKEDFPIFENHPDLIYLDNAATSQRPRQVIDSITNFYEKENANIHRGVYPLSELSTQRYEEARKKIAGFINAQEKEIIFTRNTTESLNLLCHRIKALIKEGKDEIVISEVEHHSNLVPWQQFCKRHNFKLKFIPIKENYELNYEKARELITDKTAILSITHVSNVFGTINNIRTLIELAKKKGALTIIDAAQSISHIKIDVKELDCDFLAFSSHKMLGPTGIGILYGKEELLKELPPFLFGGGMINRVSYEDSTWAEIPEKFEAGTQNIAEAIGLAKAIEYIEEIGFDQIKTHESELVSYTIEKLSQIEGLTLYSSKENNTGLFSFNIKNIHPHDVASILAENNIAIRAGHHCCMPLMKKLGIAGTCRASISLFNTKEDIDKLVKGINKVKEKFK